jgi:hypothetical protein
VATFILKKDNLKLGLVLGLLGPALGLVVVYFMKFSSFNDSKLITSLGALCLLANAVLFTIYINTHRDNTAKGIFATTLVYGIAILVIKIFI